MNYCEKVHLPDFYRPRHRWHTSCPWRGPGPPDVPTGIWSRPRHDPIYGAHLTLRNWNMAQIGKDSPWWRFMKIWCVVHCSTTNFYIEHHSTRKQIIIYTQKCFAGKDLWRSCLPTSWALLGRAQPGIQHDSGRSLWSKIDRSWQTLAALLPLLPGCIQRQCDGGTPPERTKVLSTVVLSQETHSTILQSSAGLIHFLAAKLHSSWSSLKPRTWVLHDFGRFAFV
jgi:hypothetical protein